MQFIPEMKAAFSASLLQSSVSHDPSEIWCSRNISDYYQLKIPILQDL